MSDAVEEPGGEEPTAEEVQAQETQETLDKAIAQGYNPDYDGPNAKTPEEFIEFGETRTPVLKERNDKLTKDNELLFNKLQDVESKLDGFQETHIKGMRDARADEKAKTIRDLEGQRREAADAGEMETYDRLDGAIAAERAKPIPEPQPAPKAQPIDPSFHPWHANNPWYQTDTALTGAADAIGEGLLRSNPNLQGKEFYAEVERQVKQEFPHKFGGNGKDHPSTEGRNKPVPKKTAKNTWNDIPESARQDALTQIGSTDDFMFKNKEEYADKYFEMYPGEG